MGIVNVTPDSFSGDGLAREGLTQDDVVSAALAQARRFVEAGAEILDVGAESTRPASVYGERAAVGPSAFRRSTLRRRKPRSCFHPMGYTPFRCE